MTSPTIERTQRFFDALGRGEVLDEMIDPDMLMTNTDGFFIADDYHGPEGFRRWWKNLTEDLDDARFESDGFVEVTADVLAIRCRLHGRARTAEMDVDLVWWAAAGFRDGKIVRLAGATSKRHALEIADEIARASGATG